MTQRISAHDLAEQLRGNRVTVIDVGKPMGFASGPLVFASQSGNRGAKGVQTLLERGHANPVTDLEGGLPGWQQAGLPVRTLKNDPLPLMRQVQIAAGSLVLLGLVLANTVAPAWILLSWFVVAGLAFAGVSGFRGRARLLALMPWNKGSL